jgi:hypothetical protein
MPANSMPEHHAWWESAWAGAPRELLNVLDISQPWANSSMAWHTNWIFSFLLLQMIDLMTCSLSAKSYRK